jgi:hypothetical protein
VSTPTENVSPARAARQALRAGRAEEKQSASLAPLVRAVERETGKKVARVVVHYDDKTQDTIRPVSSEERKQKRIAARDAHHEIRKQRRAGVDPVAKKNAEARDKKPKAGQ